MIWSWIKGWLGGSPPVLSAPPTHGQMRRLCGYHARLFRKLAHDSRVAPADQRRALEQRGWIHGVLRHHPLNEDLARTIRQSEDLLRQVQNAVVAAGEDD